MQVFSTQMHRRSQFIGNQSWAPFSIEIGLDQLSSSSTGCIVVDHKGIVGDFWYFLSFY